MDKIRNLSIRKTVILYMGVSLLLSFIVSAAVMFIAVRTQEQIWQRYVDENNREEVEWAFNYGAPRPADSEMTGTDHTISEICDFLETYGILVISIVGSVLAVMLFYRNKIKMPLEELSSASEMIARNELDFKIQYSNRDELGRLCLEFEKMRAQLEQNERKLWRMVEEEKSLRAATAHDIRTPLSILKGYQEMLLEFIPQGELEPEKLVEMLEEGMKQIDRIDRFVERMRTLSGLEKRQLQYEETDIFRLEQQIGKNGAVMAEETGQKIIVKAGGSEDKFLADTDLILEVTENLLTNAFRYAKAETVVTIAAFGEELETTVRDDGSGFLVPQEQAVKAWYHSNPQDELNHSGLGMYISRILCEKHGGRLLVGNQESGGAVVKAIFQIKKPD